MGEVATFINGRAYSQDELLDEGKYTVLRVGNFYTNDSWYYSDLELPEKYYAQEGDLLYTWSATFGPHIWHGNKVIYHYHIWKVELSNKLDKTFAVQLLEEDKANILANKNGSTMVHITKEGMEQKQIVIPSNVREQQKIGAYFSTLDHLITLHQRKYNELKKLKKHMQENMFPQKGQTDMAELESVIEKRLIEQLCSGESQWTYRPDLKTEEDLWNNFKYILEQNNKAKLDDVPLSESEFAKIKNDLSHASFYDAGKWLVGENGKVYVHVQRGNETLHLVVMNNEHVAGGSSVYEVINQYQAFKDETDEKGRDRRFDVSLLINGIPRIDS